MTSNTKSRNRQLDNTAMQTVISKRKSGLTWNTIAATMLMPESTLRGMLVRAGVLQSGPARTKRVKQKGRKQATPAPSTPAPTTPAQDALAAAVQAALPAGTTPILTFVEPEWFPLLRYAMKSEKGATMFGPRGCGKSTAVRQLATQLGAQTVTMQCAANMQIDSLLGTWTSEQGTLRFIDGPLAIAARNGAWLLAEESNVIHPGVWSAVNTLTDRTGEGLRLPTGEVITPHQHFRLVLIYNEGYAGTREVNPALKDRLMPIYCGYLPEAQEIQVLQSQAATDAATATQVRQLAEMIRAANLRFDLSPRALIRLINLAIHEKFGWANAFRVAIMDLVGTPELAAPQRAALEEIARNTVHQWK